MMYSHPRLNKNVCARNRHATLTCCIFLVYNSCKDINLKHKLKIEEQKATTIITSFEKVKRKCSMFTSKKFPHSSASFQLVHCLQLAITMPEGGSRG